MSTVKPDLVVTAMHGYQWEQIRAFVISLERSGFQGEKVALISDLPPTTQQCLLGHGWDIVPSRSKPANSIDLITRARYEPILQFLQQRGRDYRYVLWLDCGDQIFQRDPSPWLEEHIPPHTIVAAREGWIIGEEKTYNDQWIKLALPDEYDWLSQEEVICAGTIAGTPDVVLELLSKIYTMTCVNPQWGCDQAYLNYLIHKPCSIAHQIPKMADGWVATCASISTENFHSVSSHPDLLWLDDYPKFDTESGLVLTPDNSKPFVLVHQYNRDGWWANAMFRKYRW